MKNKIDSLPEWATRFLRLICPVELLEEIEGDLIQRYHAKWEEVGKFRARWNLLINVLAFCRPGILFRKRRTMPAFGSAVIGNYVLSTYRHARRNKLNAGFKLGGLVIALFSILVIALYVSYQLSYDRHHEDYSLIYRVNTQRKENGKIEQYGVAPRALAPLIKNTFSEVKAAARIQFANQGYIRYNDKVSLGDVCLTDKSVFDVFTFSFLAGSKRALDDPNSIVLTRSLATVIFGDEDPMNKMIMLNDSSHLYQVSAIIDDFKTNSHFRVEAFIPIVDETALSKEEILSPVSFVDNSAVLFVRFFDERGPAEFVGHIGKILDRYIPTRERAETGFGIFIQPLKDIYLAPALKFEFTAKGNRVYLLIFSVLGVFLFVIACINYTNLSLANFINRSREMGVRKALGGRKGMIATQVVLETALYCVIALVMAVGVLFLVFPNVAEFSERNLSFAMLGDTNMLAVVAMVLVFLMIVASVVPAYWFSTSKVILDLKGVSGHRSKLKFSQGLLFVQCMISIVCVIATLTVGDQINFIHTNSLGVERKKLMVLTIPENFSVKKMVDLKASLRSIPGVTHVSNSSFCIGGAYWKDWYTVEVDGEMKSFELYEVFSDDELFETLGMKLLAGRTFNASFPADSGAAFVINETAARELGWKDPIGKRIFTHPEEKGKWDGTVVGVVNDININTLHHKVQPLVMRLPWQNLWPDYFVYIRYQGNASETRDGITSVFNSIQPGYPLNLRSVDEFYNDSYEKENKAYASLKFGTIVILLVSALGIFSLAMYFSSRKMKEFGIRKVLGASSRDIAIIHVNTFLKIAITASVLAAPVAYYAMAEWLTGFAYRVEQDVWLSIVSIVLLLVLIVISTSYSAIKAGRLNPVEVINKE